MSVPHARIKLEFSEAAEASGESSTTGAGAGAGTGKGKGKGKGKGRRGGRLESEGPLLITHSGISGPSTLRLSAFAAREMAAHRYRATATVSWVADLNEEAALAA